ncbi:MAG: VOC family protein [Hyphomonadaceae bacterium]|nr:VOC family protein [Hyphomonadaceae bacterium]
MASNVKPVHFRSAGASVIPTVRYRDVSAAIAWLQEAFGFTVHRLVKDAQGTIIYGELAFGTGMVMVVPIQDTPFGKLMVQPDEIGGVETQICYLFVDDAKAHYARAKAAGAEIVLDIEVEADGSRGYSCRDLEGHLWNLGTHNPWRACNAAGGPRWSRRTWTAFAASLLLAVAGSFYVHTSAREGAGELVLALFGKVPNSIESAQAEPAPDEDADEPADGRSRHLRELIARERLARIAADQHVKDIRAQLLNERRAHAAAELAAKTAGESQTPDLGPVAALQAAEAAAAEARGRLAKTLGALQAVREQLGQAQRTRESAERGAKDAREQVAQLLTARAAAEQAAREARARAMRERRVRIVAQRALRKVTDPPPVPYPPLL